MDRRTAIQLIAAAGMGGVRHVSWAEDHAKVGLTVEEDAFLDDMTRRGVLYYLEQSSPTNGQTLDRAFAQNTTGSLDPRKMASIAATGFGLAALCLADKRGYHPHERLAAQVRRTLAFHLEHLQHDHGFLYHFNHIDEATPFGNSEVSPMDTSILLCGALTARVHFHNDPEIVRLATALYERVEWPYMLNGGDTFSMGLRRGHFISSRWNHYCEHMMLYLLAIGSPSHPVNASAWSSWSRPRIRYAGFDFIGAADPLFVHQFSHAWFDFRNKRDQYADYFANSILATRAHKAFCLSLGAAYSESYWGISASDSAHGYTAWGGPSADGKGFGGIDGSVVPNATAGSLPFLPKETLRVLLSLKKDYGAKVYGRYGFCDAFHPAANWYDEDVLGLDLGIGLVMAENLRTGFVWETFAKNPEVSVAMQRAGFRSV